MRSATHVASDRSQIGVQQMSYASCLENNNERAHEYYAVALDTLESRLRFEPVTRPAPPPIQAVAVAASRMVAVPKPETDAGRIERRMREQRDVHILCFLEMKPAQNWRYSAQQR